MSDIDNKTSENIRASLNTKIFGKKILYFDTLESTNKLALAELETNNEAQNSSEGFVYITKIQTHGQGSYGNSWQSDSSLGLWSSIVVYSPYKHNPLTFVPAIAIACMLKDYGIESHLKWPNDVLVGNKKISGILCQAKQVEGSKFACVIGVGINVNHSIDNFSPELQNKAISMKMITGKEYNTLEIFKSYIEHFENVYLNSSNIIEEWKMRSKIIGSDITGKLNHESFEAKVLDITNDGYLKILRDGKIEILNSRTGFDIDTDYV